jgi:hypothetical protein
MAQPIPDRASLDQILKLVNQLPVDEREQLRLKLNTKSWAERWDALVIKVRDRNKDLPPLTDDEIVSEMKSIRKDVWAERAKSSN